jgi:hypothetical protein
MLNGTARPRSFAERELEKVQRKVTEGQIAERRRRELIVYLHREEHMSQVEIAARLTRAATAVGGQPVGDDAVWKIVKAARSAR